VNGGGKRLRIHTMYFDEELAETDGTTRFILSGGHRTWRLLITLESYPKIEFHDLKVPYLMSEKKLRK